MVHPLEGRFVQVVGLIQIAQLCCDVVLFTMWGEVSRCSRLCGVCCRRAGVRRVEWLVMARGLLGCIVVG